MLPKPCESSHARLRQSKATASTTAIQPLEITTTAVVASSSGSSTPNGMATRSSSFQTDHATQDTDHQKTAVRRTQARHHHHHHVKSPVSRGDNSAQPSVSPLVSPSLAAMAMASSAPNEFSALPPPLIRFPSEAIVALHNATSISKKTKAPLPTPPSIVELFESCFFSAVLLVQWSNVVGPMVEKVWSAEPLAEGLQNVIGRQVLNGEMGRTLQTVESKWIVLHRQAVICTAFLFNEGGSLQAIVLVVPVRYLRNFSQYFKVLCDRVPLELVQPLIRLRKRYRRQNSICPTALDYFAIHRLTPFVRSIMDLESVSLPTECIKVSHTLLDHASRQMLDSPFIAKVITSHLQTYGSTLLLGNTLNTMNMMINTLALFLSPEERGRSSHAHKNHKYMPDLYLQGLLIQDVQETGTRLDHAALDSIVPTTLVDMTRLVVEQTPLLPAYRELKAQHQSQCLARFEEDISSAMSEPARSPRNETNLKRLVVFHRTNDIAPMVQTLLDETRKIPTRMREAYLQQWRRWLMRRALALVKFVQDEAPTHLTAKTDVIATIKDALSLKHAADFSIVLTQAEKLKPGMIDFVNTFARKSVS